MRRWIVSGAVLCMIMLPTENAFPALEEIGKAPEYARLVDAFKGTPLEPGPTLGPPVSRLVQNSSTDAECTKVKRLFRNCYMQLIGARGNRLSG
jgi:hypothetical protein